jgi:hypothetical protein
MKSGVFTNFENHCAILATMWFAMQEDEKFKNFRDENFVVSPLEYLDNEEFRDVIEDCKPGLMAAYLVDSELIEPTKAAVGLIESTYSEIAKFLGVSLKKEFETFEEMIDAGTR